MTERAFPQRLELNSPSVMGYERSRKSCSNGIGSRLSTESFRIGSGHGGPSAFQWHRLKIEH